jgi:hypothetical protein
MILRRVARLLTTGALAALIASPAFAEGSFDPPPTAQFSQ